jgi:prepilin-type N-terminal cleavage/methylation domain-containing protein/prepilin-type processing-associated H-X9-DG protein
MQVTRRGTPRLPRGGFTLIELLVVISIIAVLAALILPGINGARATARRTQCMSQMRNVSLALQTYATNNSGNLPYLVTSPTPTNTGTVQIDQDNNAATSGTDVMGNVGSVGASWAVQLLPYVEQQALFDRLTAGAAPLAGADSPNALAGTSLQVYTCPDDPNSDANGTLSFVANAGYTTSEFWGGSLANHFPGNSYDFSFDGYQDAPVVRSAEDGEIFRGTGMFLMENPTSAVRSALDRVPDGASHTILLSENLQATAWASFAVEDVGFVVPFAAGGNESGDFANNEALVNGLGPTPPSPPTVLKENALDFDTPLPAPLGINLAIDPVLATGRINAEPGASESTRPRPSSLHPNVVNVMYADGHGGPLASTISDSVWVRLVSSSGERFGQQVLSDNDF